LQRKLFCEQTAWVAQVSAALVVTHDQTKNQITAFYDGKCPMCATLADAVRCSARQDAFDLRDMHKQKSMPFAHDAVEKEIHVVDRDGQTYRGAQAILKIASQYPRLRTLAAIGRLSVVRPLLPVGYSIVARNRRFLFGAASRVFWLKAMIALVFCIGLVMSSSMDRAAYLPSGSRTELSTVVHLSG